MTTRAAPPEDWRRSERLTRKQAAAVLNISVRLLDMLLTKGELTRLNPRQNESCRKTYLHTGEVEAYLDGGSDGAERYRKSQPLKFKRVKR
jgi:hypothetical protein